MQQGDPIILNTAITYFKSHSEIQGIYCPECKSERKQKSYKNTRSLIAHVRHSHSLEDKEVKQIRKQARKFYKQTIGLGLCKTMIRSGMIKEIEKLEVKI